MADSVTVYFGEHSTYGYEETGPTLKSERDQMNIHGHFIHMTYTVYDIPSLSVY